ncbi:hypothetical protein Ancab_010626, partial [Ancistrocladus abbreviatus]
ISESFSVSIGDDTFPLTVLEESAGVTSFPNCVDRLPKSAQRLPVVDHDSHNKGILNTSPWESPASRGRSNSLERGNGRGRQAGSLASNSKDVPHYCRTHHNHRFHLKPSLRTVSSRSRCGTGPRGRRNPTPLASSSAAPYV